MVERSKSIDKVADSLGQLVISRYSIVPTVFGRGRSTIPVVYQIKQYTTLTTMSNYPVSPPSYGSAAAQGPKPNNKYFDEREGQEPLLASSSRNGAGGIYDQPAHDDVPDDFKVLTPSPTFISILRFSSV